MSKKYIPFGANRKKALKKGLNDFLISIKKQTSFVENYGERYKISPENIEKRKNETLEAENAIKKILETLEN